MIEIEKLSAENIATLNYIQTMLKCPKTQHNSFGNYDFRSCEGILEALKPILKETGCAITFSDYTDMKGDKHYIESVATLYFKDGGMKSTSTPAGEADSRKGMDDSQISGSTISYARKYALCGLLAIDDNKDADYLNKGENVQNTRKTSNPQQGKQTITDKQVKFIYAKAKEYGFDFDAIHSGIKKYFKKEHLNNLTKAEMDELLLKFKNAKRKEA